MEIYRHNRALAPSDLAADVCNPLCISHNLSPCVPGRNFSRRENQQRSAFLEMLLSLSQSGDCGGREFSESVCGVYRNEVIRNVRNLGKNEVRKDFYVRTDLSQNAQGSHSVQAPEWMVCCQDNPSLLWKELQGGCINIKSNFQIFKEFIRKLYSLVICKTGVKLVELVQSGYLHTHSRNQLSGKTRNVQRLLKLVFIDYFCTHRLEICLSKTKIR